MGLALSIVALVIAVLALALAICMFVARREGPQGPQGATGPPGASAVCPVIGESLALLPQNGTSQTGIPQVGSALSQLGANLPQANIPQANIPQANISQNLGNLPGEGMVLMGAHAALHREGTVQNPSQTNLEALRGKDAPEHWNLVELTTGNEVMVDNRSVVRIRPTRKGEINVHLRLAPNMPVGSTFWVDNASPLSNSLHASFQIYSFASYYPSRTLTSIPDH